jgi:hypothetical protein
MRVNPTRDPMTVRKTVHACTNEQEDVFVGVFALYS